MSLYDRLTYEAERMGGEYNWLGNLRWYVSEEKAGYFSFRCISDLPGMTHEECTAIQMTKRLFEVNVAEPESAKWIYGADYIKTDKFSVYMPFYEYGCLVYARQQLDIFYEGEAYRKDGVCVIKNGAYYIGLKSDEVCSLEEGKITLQMDEPHWIALAFHVEEKKAIADCRRLFVTRKLVLADNKLFWNRYLESCPTVELSQEYVYKHEALNIEEHYSPEDFRNRQLWHYWCVLVNVSEVEFNKFPLYMAPDKISWIGTWSNDGPQCMASLSLTNQKELAKRLIVSYLTNSMTEKGELSWYMHADGVGCYGTKGDVGRFSHGAPYMPQVVEYYIRNTGDKTILSADAGGMSVYEKLKIYMLNLHPLRDINQDSLIEWANLWETGWDDKGGTFFASASLEEWMEMVSTGTDEEIAEFYKKHQRPVIAIVEQVITLWSLSAMSRLAAGQEDTESEEYCLRMYEKMKSAVENRCWNERDAFYYDIDVKTGIQTTEKSADAFYWMSFEENQERRKALLQHLNNEDEFNCYYIPMLSKDSAGFDRFGYWGGGHWPREMSIIAMGLHHCGYDEKAMELLVRAIMADEGNIIPEVREAIEGKASTPVTKMACAIMNVMALLDVSEKVKWRG